MTPTPTERVTAALADAGCNPRNSSPTQWVARCPVQANHAHGDKNPSLSVGESPSGKALLTCHKGCTVPEIAAALNLGLRDLFPEDAPREPRVGAHGIEKARYAYTDEHGELLYEVVKFVGGDGRKTFRARKPSPDGTWIWSTAGVRRVIYKLPEVLAAVADGRPVVICEGEKDAETAAWLFAGQRAATTCNPFGAGKWSDDYDEWFRGAHVQVIADDDAVGRLHADTVRTHLAGIAASVTTWLPKDGHKDLSEMAGAGGNVGDLRPLTGPTPTVEEVAAEEDRLASMVVVWSEFWSQDHKSEEWAIEPLIPAGRAVAIFAPAKAGKSLTLLSAIVPATLGLPVWGIPNTRRLRTLYLDYEMTAGDLRERLEMLGYGPEHDLSHLAYALIPSLPPLDTPDGGVMLLELAKRHEAELVVVDTFGRAAQGDENDADTTRDFYRYTGGLLKANGIACARTDHAGKDAEKGQRGSSAKNDDVDVVWRLERLQGGVKLMRTHSRLMWVPEGIVLDAAEDEDGVWRFVRQAGTTGWKAGTKECAAELDRLGVPVGASVRVAQAALSAALLAKTLTEGTPRRTGVVSDAQKWRKQEAEKVVIGGRETLGKRAFGDQSGSGDGNAGNTPSDLRETLGKHRETLTEAVFPVSLLPRRETVTPNPDDGAIDDDNQLDESWSQYL